jgi:hypothetical protein
LGGAALTPVPFAGAFGLPKRIAIPAISRIRYGRLLMSSGIWSDADAEPPAMPA